MQKYAIRKKNVEWKFAFLIATCKLWLFGRSQSWVMTVHFEPKSLASGNQQVKQSFERKWRTKLFVYAQCAIYWVRKNIVAIQKF